MCYVVWWGRVSNEKVFVGMVPTGERVEERPIKNDRMREKVSERGKRRKRRRWKRKGEERMGG